MTKPTVLQPTLHTVLGKRISCTVRTVTHTCFKWTIYRYYDTIIIKMIIIIIIYLAFGDDGENSRRRSPPPAGFGIVSWGCFFGNSATTTGDGARNKRLSGCRLKNHSQSRSNNNALVDGHGLSFCPVVYYSHPLTHSHSFSFSLQQYVIILLVCYEDKIK